MAEFNHGVMIKAKETGQIQSYYMRTLEITGYLWTQLARVFYCKIVCIKRLLQSGLTVKVIPEGTESNHGSV